MHINHESENTSSTADVNRATGYRIHGASKHAGARLRFARRRSRGRNGQTQRK
jgi:hypothetical protein